MMRDLKFLKLFYGLMLVMVSAAFVSCVDDNDDTEAPFLEVSPTTLIFGLNGQPADGSQASFEIKANRSWKATVKEDKSWVTLSKTEGEGSATIQVSIPENINDEASVVIEISNKVGVLMSKTVTIRSGSISPSVAIYHESAGTATVASPWPLVGVYEGWAKTGPGSTNVTYSGTNASVRSTGIASDNYNQASGHNSVFFGTATASFVINKIALGADQKDLRLTFGGSRSSKNDDGSYDNTFNTSKFEVALSADGTNWVTVPYTKNNGDAASPYWVFATANFTLKEAVENIYIKFSATESSVFRLDDITLATGIGGDVIDLSGGGTEPGEATEISIPTIISMLTDVETVLDANADRFFTAVVQSDVAGGNYT
ncbi:BACON domain-containing protein, partial [Bacteroides reticulotermitis]|uniref:BACON domain-containing protein n=1 Tax=Bacteroides reticulotermitis TaxID=1133319 RepID=UPI003A88D2D2